MRHSKAGPRTQNEFAPRRSSAGDGSDPDPAGQPQARHLRREGRERALALRRKLSREAALRRREARERALVLRRKLSREAALRRREARGRALEGGPGAEAYAGREDDPTTAMSADATSADSGAAGQPSTFFATAYAQEYDTYNTKSEGDLWPSCWCEDDYLYAANGDGDGFTVNSTPAPDIAVSQISGVPGHLSGRTIAKGDQLGKVWDTSGNYNRKPTGMVCVDGVIYLAIQDLHKDFKPLSAVLWNSQRFDLERQRAVAHTAWSSSGTASISARASLGWATRSRRPSGEPRGSKLSSRPGQLEDLAGHIPREVILVLEGTSQPQHARGRPEPQEASSDR